mmetsp:Transcript_9206/g.24517  ORF Transcript_9206/g.24517 Transcript_9206/m.24517 type:complete len:106 (+) Transcript_9206:155-472(+)
MCRGLAPTLSTSTAPSNQTPGNGEGLKPRSARQRAPPMPPGGQLPDHCPTRAWRRSNSTTRSSACLQPPVASTARGACHGAAARGHGAACGLQGVCSRLRKKRFS